MNINIDCEVRVSLYIIGREYQYKSSGNINGNYTMWTTICMASCESQDIMRVSRTKVFQELGISIDILRYEGQCIIWVIKININGELLRSMYIDSSK